MPPFVPHKHKLGLLDVAADRWLASGSPVDRPLLADEPGLGELVDPRVVRRRVCTWRPGDRRHAYAVLVLLILELWMTLPRAFAGPPLRPAPSGLQLPPETQVAPRGPELT